MRSIVILFIVLTPMLVFATEPQKEFINPDALVKSPSYTHIVAVRGGKILFLSGQVAANAKGETIGKGDLKAQAIQVHENLKDALAAAGASFDDIVKLNTYVVNLNPDMLPILRDVRGKYFEEKNRPASTLVGVTSLAGEDYLIEIEAIAVVR